MENLANRGIRWTIAGIIGLILLPLIALAARTNDLWLYPSGGTYIQPNFPSGLDVLLYGSSHYINFGTVSGTNGYGFRDSGGVMQVKNSGGSWVPFGSAGGGSSGGTWATSTSQVAGQLINSPNNTTDIVVIGASATTTANYYIDPNINRAFLLNASTTNLSSVNFLVIGQTDGCAQFTGSLLTSSGSGCVTSNFSTTSTNYYHQSSTTVPTIYKTNVWTGLNSFTGGIRSDAFSNRSAVSLTLGTISANDILFQTNSITGMVLQNTTNNVGIGTTSPYAKLSVVGQVVGAYFTATTSIASTFPYASTTAFSFTSTSTGSSGINLSGGCFAINGACITSGSVTTTGGGDPFTHPTPAQSATTTGLIILASSTLQTLNVYGTATSTIAGPLIIGTGGAGNTYPYMRIGSTTPNYGYFNNDTLDIYDKRNDMVSANVGNGASQPCAMSAYWLDGDIPGLGTDYGLDAYTNTGFTGLSTCPTGIDLTYVRPESTLRYNPTGDMYFGLGTTTANRGFHFVTRGLGATAYEALTITVPGLTSVGTTTPFLAQFTVASSTAPQLALSDGNPASLLWTMRSINSNLYIATSTALATSSAAALSINGANSAFTFRSGATSTFTSGLQATNLALTGSATNTAATGFNIASGCFAVAGVCISGSGGATSPAGSNTQVQFNNAGAFGATSTFTFSSGGAGRGTLTVGPSSGPQFFATYDQPNDSEDFQFFNQAGSFGEIQVSEVSPSFQLFHQTTNTAVNLFPNTTSTMSSGLKITGGGLQVSTLNASNCDVKADTSGNQYCGTDASGGAASWPFTLDQYNSIAAQSTTTNLWVKNGMLIASSTYFTQASTTLFTNSGTTYFTSLSNGPLSVDSAGRLYKAATTTYSTGLTYANGAVTCDTASGSVFGCLSTQSFNKFNSATTTFTSPLIYTVGTNAVTWSGLATTSQPSSSNLLVSNGGAGTYGVATGTISSSGGITTTAGRAAVGGALSIACDVATASVPGCLAAADFTTFASKITLGNLFTLSTTYSTTTLATTTPSWFKTAFYSSSTPGTPSIIENFIAGKSTTTNATTTSLGFTGITNTLLSTNGSGGVVATSTLDVAFGGTGSTTLGGILKGNGVGTVQSAVNGVDFSLITALTCSAGSHFVGVTAAGTFTCSADSGGAGGGGSGGWTFIAGGIYNSTTTDQVLIGATATTTLAKLEVQGGIWSTYASTTLLGAQQAFFGGSATTTFATNGTFSVASTDGTSTITSALQLGTTAGANKLKITAERDYSASNSVGGLVNITNTNSTGAGLVIYTNNGGTSAGNLVNVRCDNALMAHDCFKIDHDGIGDGLAITATAAASNALSLSNTGVDHTLNAAYTGTTANKGAANFTSTNTTGSVFQVTGSPDDLGVFKSSLTLGTNSSAAGSFDASGSRGQGLFVKGNAGTTTAIINALDSNSATAFKVDGNRLTTMINASSTQFSISDRSWFTGLATFGAASTTDLTTSNSLHLSQLAGNGLLMLDLNKKVVQAPATSSTGFYANGGTNGNVLGITNGVIGWVATSSSASLTGGVNSMLAVWTSASTIGATSSPIAANYIATSSTATSTFAGKVMIGTTSTTVMAGTMFTVDGTTSIMARAMHVGPVSCGTGGLIVTSLQGDEFCGSDSNVLNGVQRIVSNNDAGTGGWAGYTLNNNLADNTLTHFAGIYYNSSGYNDNTYGTATNLPNLLQIQNTEAAIILETGTSTKNVGSPGFSRLSIIFNPGSTNTTDEAARFTPTGLLGLGTTTPAWKMTIASSTGPQLALVDGTAGSNAWTFRSINNTLYIATSTATATSTTAAITVGSGPRSQVLIATSSNANATLATAGQVFMSGLTASGATQAGDLCISSANEVINDSVACIVSSIRFKKNVNPLDAGLKELMRLRPVSFFYKPEFNGAWQNDPNYNGEQVGFIAEEVQKIDPRLTVVEKDGVTPHSVRYENMTALLAKAIQEQQIQIERLQKAARSVEENWQWAAFGLLALFVLRQQMQIRKLKKRHE